jgi:hypothetical protein
VPGGIGSGAIRAEIGEVKIADVRGKDAGRHARLARGGRKPPLEDKRSIGARAIDGEIEAVEPGAAILGNAEKFDRIWLADKLAAGRPGKQRGRAQRVAQDVVEALPCVEALALARRAAGSWRRARSAPSPPLARAA